MYDELIKRLRERCVFLFPHHGESRSYDADLMHQAADAIEELMGFVQEAERDRDEYRERLDKAADAIEELQAAEKKYLANISALEAENQHLKREREWMPVTEQLPCLTTPVLVTDGIEVDIAWMYGVPPRWITSYTAIDEDKPTHWMPLPQTPKEK